MGKVSGYTLPAFPGGLNQIDALDRVPETDATELLNLFPTGTRLALRKGIESQWVADTAAVKTLANLVLADGTNKLVAAADNDLFIQNSSSSTSIKGSTTPTSDEWQTVVFNHKLYMVNGADTGQVYNGTSVSDISFTGVTLADLVNVAVHNESLYFVEKDSGSVWFGDVKAVGSSALTEQDFSYFMKFGGYIVSCGSWSDILGDVSQDLFWVLTSEGELLCYQGLAPDIVGWGIVARYVIGKPLGYRAHLQVENDVWFITDKGIIPLSVLFQGSASYAAQTISRKVNATIREAAEQFPFSYLYDAKFYPLERKVFINLPTTATSTQQLVCNLETGAWTIYRYAVSGAALCIEVSGGVPYCGAVAGDVYKMETGYNDDDLPISFRVKSGFNFYGSRGQYKVFKDVRPIIRTSAGSLSLQLDVDTDFRAANSYATITVPDLGTSTESTWDSATWDSADWASEDRYLFKRYSLRGQGHCGALRIAGSMKDALLEFNAFEIRFEQGGQT